MAGASRFSPLVLAPLVALACGAPSRSSSSLATVEVPSSRNEPQRAEPDAGSAAQPASYPSLAACIEAFRSAPSLERADSRGAAAYRAAYELERQGDVAAARKAYFEIIKDMPASAYVPLTYLAFGELFAREAASDRAKWELALAAYREVEKYPPLHNPAFAYASYAIGRAEHERGDDSRALISYKRAIEVARADSRIPCSAAILSAAERGLVESYAVVGRPESAFEFFHVVASDDAKTIALLVNLIDELVRRGRRADACRAFQPAAAVDDAALRERGGAACK